MDNILRPLVYKHDWILKGTGDLINTLENTKIDLQDPVILSGDIVSMYTSLHTMHGIALITKIMIKEQFTQDKIRCYQSLLKWIFKNNFFHYKGTLYRQKHGAAMGSSCIPNFANLVMAHIESTKILSKIPELPMPIYRRLIDDTLMVVEKQHVNQWKSIFIEATSPYLDWTFDSSESSESVPMLDLDIFFGQKYQTYKKIDFIGYKKPFNNNLYTAPDSHCPDHYKFSWITGENIRLIRNNSNVEQYNIQLEEYVNNLHTRGYDSNVVLKHLRHKFSDRPYLLHPKERSSPDMVPILLPNIAGYEHLTEAIRIYLDLTKSTFSIPHMTPIILRGTTLESLTNQSNRTILS